MRAIDEKLYPTMQREIEAVDGDVIAYECHVFGWPRTVRRPRRQIRLLARVSKDLTFCVADAIVDARYLPGRPGHVAGEKIRMLSGAVWRIGRAVRPYLDG